MKLRIVYDAKKYGLGSPYVIEEERHTFWRHRPYWTPRQRCLFDCFDETFKTYEDAKKELDRIVAEREAVRYVVTQVETKEAA